LTASEIEKAPRDMGRVSGWGCCGELNTQWAAGGRLSRQAGLVPDRALAQEGACDTSSLP